MVQVEVVGFLHVHPLDRQDPLNDFSVDARD